jgi:hypothetical protein
MKQFLNIEKSALRQREYVTHINGARQHIRKYYAGWETYDINEPGPYVNGRNLAELDKKIERIKSKLEIPQPA